MCSSETTRASGRDAQAAIRAATAHVCSAGTRTDRQRSHGTSRGVPGQAIAVHLAHPLHRPSATMLMQRRNRCCSGLMVATHSSVSRLGPGDMMNAEDRQTFDLRQTRQNAPRARVRLRGRAERLLTPNRGAASNSSGSSTVEHMIATHEVRRSTRLRSLCPPPFSPHDLGACFCPSPIASTVTNTPPHITLHEQQQRPGCGLAPALLSSPCSCMYADPPSPP